MNSERLPGEQPEEKGLTQLGEELLESVAFSNACTVAMAAAAPTLEDARRELGEGLIAEKVWEVFRDDALAASRDDRLEAWVRENLERLAGVFVGDAFRRGVGGVDAGQQPRPSLVDLEVDQRPQAQLAVDHEVEPDKGEDDAQPGGGTDGVVSVVEHATTLPETGGDGAETPRDLGPGLRREGSQIEDVAGARETLAERSERLRRYFGFEGLVPVGLDTALQLGSPRPPLRPRFATYEVDLSGAEEWERRFHVGKSCLFAQHWSVEMREMVGRMRCRWARLALFQGKSPTVQQCRHLAHDLMSEVPEVSFFPRWAELMGEAVRRGLTKDLAPIAPLRPVGPDGITEDQWWELAAGVWEIDPSTLSVREGAPWPVFVTRPHAGGVPANA